MFVEEVWTSSEQIYPKSHSVGVSHSLSPKFQVPMGPSQVQLLVVMQRDSTLRRRCLHAQRQWKSCFQRRIQWFLVLSTNHPNEPKLIQIIWLIHFDLNNQNAYPLSQPAKQLLAFSSLRTLQMSSTTGQQCCKWHNVLFQAGTRVRYIIYSHIVTNSIKYHQQLQFVILPLSGSNERTY